MVRVTSPSARVDVHQLEVSHSGSLPAYFAKGHGLQLTSSAYRIVVAWRRMPCRGVDTDTHSHTFNPLPPHAQRTRTPPPHFRASAPPLPSNARECWQATLDADDPACYGAEGGKKRRLSVRTHPERTRRKD